MLLYNFLLISVLLSVFFLAVVNGAEIEGGWKFPDEIGYGLKGPCTIERVDAFILTPENFLKKYAFEKPVIIFNYDVNKKFRNKCVKKKLLAKWRDTKVVLNTANTYSYTRVESTFGEYVEQYLAPQNLTAPANETLYLFGDIDQTVWKPLLDVYVHPKWSLPGYDPALSFGIAGAGTGVPFHFHGPGFAEVIHGNKRWFLQPYDQRPNFNPDKTTLNWYINDYPMLSIAERPLECLLEVGEILYFPDKWWHATLNSETSVFISTFFSPSMSKPIIESIQTTADVQNEL